MVTIGAALLIIEPPERIYAGLRRITRRTAGRCLSLPRSFRPLHCAPSRVQRSFLHSRDQRAPCNFPRLDQLPDPDPSIDTFYGDFAEAPDWLRESSEDWGGDVEVHSPPPTRSDEPAYTPSLLARLTM